MKRLILVALFLCTLLSRIDDAFGCGDLGPRFNFPPSPPPKPNYHGLYRSPNESGWGIGVSHQGDQIHATWFTYDRSGAPTWLVMPSMTTTGGYNPFTGPLYSTTIPAAGAEPLMIGIGSGELDISNGLFTYSIGPRRSKRIVRNVFDARRTDCYFGADQGPRPNYTELWGPSEGSSWGIYIAHQGDVLFATWLTYRPDGNNEWLVMPRLERTGIATYSGAMYRTHGPAYDANPWDESKVTFTEVGRAAFEFAEDDAQFHHTGERSGSETITRRTFDYPVSVCR